MPWTPRPLDPPASLPGSRSSTERRRPLPMNPPGARSRSRVASRARARCVASGASPPTHRRPTPHRRLPRSDPGHGRVGRSSRVVTRALRQHADAAGQHEHDDERRGHAAPVAAATATSAPRKAARPAGTGLERAFQRGEPVALPRGHGLQIVVEQLERADLGVHASTSVVSCIPRSCSNNASFFRPRLTRCRAFCSVHARRWATSA